MSVSVLLRRLVSAVGGLLVALWLSEIGGLVKLHDLARVTALVFAALLVAFLSKSAWEVWRSPRRPERTRALVLAGLLAVAVVVRFAGLDFELLGQGFGDEGVFHEEALRINHGQPIPRTFNYGHLLYYAGAIAIWFYDLFPRAITWVLEVFYTTVEGYGVQRMLLLGVNALLSVMVVGAVFGTAYRVADHPARASASPRLQPLPAAIVAALLVIFSPVYNSIAHELIADVPAAAFATFTLYFVSRLLERESPRDYLLAGAAAGLAAASKYPGGIAAVAIFAVWLSWRVKLRAGSWNLLWAALASIAALFVVMPGVFVYPDAAFLGSGSDDIFLGFRQYVHGGWIGVQPDSNLLWYGQEILHNFGWPAILLGLVGFGFLARDQRRRWLLMGVFPAVYLALILSMNMVVRRNLAAALPGLAILVGTGVAATMRRAGGRKALWAIVGVGAMALPVWRTAAWSLSQMRPGTRELAKNWIVDNVPEGASVIRERYTPVLDEERYVVLNRRFAAWVDPDEMQSGEWDYLVLARPAYARFVEAERFPQDHQREYKERYLRMLKFPKVAEFVPGALTAGPLLGIYRLQPDQTRYVSERLFLPDEASFISHPDLRRDGPGKPLQYTRRWQFAVFKDFFAAGEYRIELGMNPPPEEGYIHVVDRNNQEVGSFSLAKPLSISLPSDEKYLFRVFIAPPTRLFGMRVSRKDTAN